MILPFILGNCILILTCATVAFLSTGHWWLAAISWILGMNVAVYMVHLAVTKD